MKQSAAVTPGFPKTGVTAGTRQQDAGSRYGLMLKPTLRTLQPSQRKVWHVCWFRQCRAYESHAIESFSRRRRRPLPSIARDGVAAGRS